MNSKKLWHSFALIFLYLVFTMFAAWIFASLFRALNAPWGIPIGIGIAVWVLALVFLIVHENHPVLARWALFLTALSCGFCIAAFLVGKGLSVSLLALLLLALLCAFCYLLLMALMSIPKASALLWYEILVFVLWLAGSVLLVVFTAQPLLAYFSLSLPEQGFMLAFALILLGFLAIGSMLDAESFSELLKMLAVPMLVATGLIALIVLLVLSGGDGCDCGDCRDCSTGEGGKRKSTKHYTKKSVTTSDLLSQGK